MPSDERSEKAETGMVPEVAYLGIVRPPFVYLCAIVLGLLLHFAWPVRLVSRAVSVPLGGNAVLVTSLCSACCEHVSNAGTPVPRQSRLHHDLADGALSLQPQSHLSVLLAAPARCRMLVNSLWLLVTLIPAVAADVVRGYPREEPYRRPASRSGTAELSGLLCVAGCKQSPNASSLLHRQVSDEGFQRWAIMLEEIRCPGSVCAT